MNDHATAAPRARQVLLYIPDLSPAERQSLQADAADAVGLDIEFRDPFLCSSHSGPMLRVIPEGIFTLGSEDTEFGHRREEGPARYVPHYKAFAIGRFPVTANEFQLFQDETGWKPFRELLWSKGDAPVMNVRSTDVAMYLHWLTEKTGEIYRLPSEEEWEYAARAGSTTPFYFGQSICCRTANVNPAFPLPEQPDPPARIEEKRRWFMPKCFPAFRADPVGLKPANAWGLQDIHGGVWELTQSAWTHTHLVSSARIDEKRLVTKGGSWFDAAVRARSAARMARLKDEMDTNLGFRVLREL